MLRTVSLCALAVAVLSGAASARSSTEASCIATNARFKAADGVRLAGAVLGRGTTGIVFAHQTDGDRCQWLPFARELSRKGYRALVFDMRGYGESAGTARTVPDRDVVAAAAELRRRGAKRIVLIGASMGGTGVVAAAARIKPPVRGVVDLSGPVELGGANAQTAVRRVRMPSLFVAGRYDDYYAAATRTLYRTSPAKDKRLLVTPNSWHGVDLVSLPAVKRAVVEFVDRVG